MVSGREGMVSHSTLLSLFSPNQAMIPMNAKANVLIDKGGHARLTDFGLTSIIGGNNSDTPPQGPNSVAATTWMAPEILNGGTVTKEVDVFMFAMVAAEVCTGEGGVRWEFLNASTPNRLSPSIPLENTRLPYLIPQPGNPLNDRRRC